MTETRTNIVATNKGLAPRDLDEMWRMCTMLAAAKDLLPRTFDTPEKIMVVLQAGSEVGLSPMQSIQGLYPVHGKVSLEAQTAVALIRASGVLEYMDDDFEGKAGDDEFCAVVRSKRSDDTHPKETRFSIRDAKIAGLWVEKTATGRSTAWATSPKDMLLWKCYARHAKRYYADIVKGLAIREDLPEPEAVQLDDSVPRRRDRKPVEATAVLADDDKEAAVQAMYAAWTQHLGDVPDEKHPYLWVQYVTYMLACQKDDMDVPTKWTGEMIERCRSAIETDPLPLPIQQIAGLAPQE